MPEFHKVRTVIDNLWLSLNIVFVLFIMSECNAQEMKKSDYSDQREWMVRSQIQSRGINDQNVLKAMRKVPRHLFVPESYRDQAYGDYPLPIGAGQTISQPYIVAIMTQVLDLDKTDKVLEIGTGSGYQAAVLAEICDSVYSIEVIESLGEKAKELLDEMKYSNVKVKVGDGHQGWIEHAPFDAIIVTCAPTHIPQPLKDQLKEGGKIVIPVGELYAQELLMLTKEKGKMKRKYLIPVRFVPMKSSEGKKY